MDGPCPLQLMCSYPLVKHRQAPTAKGVQCYAWFRETLAHGAACPCRMLRAEKDELQAELEKVAAAKAVLQEEKDQLLNELAVRWVVSVAHVSQRLSSIWGAGARKATRQD